MARASICWSVNSPEDLRVEWQHRLRGILQCGQVLFGLTAQAALLNAEIGELELVRQIDLGLN